MADASTTTAAAATAAATSNGSEIHGDAYNEEQLSSQQCDADEQDALEAYAHSSDAIVAKSVQRYVGFVRRRKRVVDTARWQLITEARGLRVYKERVERRLMKSFVSTIAADDNDNDDDACEASPVSPASPASPVASTDDTVDMKQERQQWRRQASASSARSFERQTSIVEYPSTMVSAFCIGRLRGSLDSVMAGLYADSPADARANCVIQFGDELRDCGIVQTFTHACAEQPFAYFGVKWLEKQSAHAPGVIDQLCWVERMGIHTIASGRRFGFQLLKSLVRLEDASALAGSHAARPVNVSLCYLYCQLDDDVVEVFMRGIVEIGSVVGDVSTASSATVQPSDEAEREVAAVRTAGDLILAAVRGRECGRMRKIAQLIDQSKTDREQLTACHCSKVIRGLPKVEMCTSCLQAMRQPKLVDVRKLARQQTTIKRGADARELPRSAAQQQMLLQSRFGSLRHDAELPEALESYHEEQSFRMFLPIRDPRPASNYRRARKERGNVLMQMLQRNARGGSFLPTFLRPDGDGDDEIAAAARHAVRSA